MTIKLISPMNTLTISDITYISVEVVHSGTFGIEKNRAPFLGNLGTSVISYTTSSKQRNNLAVEAAVINFKDNVAKIICQDYYQANKQDLAILQKHKDELEEKLKHDLNDAKANLELEFVLNKLRTLL